MSGYHTFKSDTAKILSDVLMGIACLLAAILVLGAIFGTPVFIATSNNQKVQNMTELCVAKGYDGWEDTISHDRTERGESPRGCFNNEDDD